MKEKSLREDKRPSWQFYPNDWQSEPGLQMCSLAARGLWLEMLCIMFKAKPRGTLTVNGRQIDTRGLAQLARVGEEEVKMLLQELEEIQVFSRLEDGTIINRRMYQTDWQARDLHKKRSDAGKKGADVKWGKIKSEQGDDFEDDSKDESSNK